MKIISGMPLIGLLKKYLSTHADVVRESGIERDELRQWLKAEGYIDFVTSDIRIDSIGSAMQKLLAVGFVRKARFGHHFEVVTHLSSINQRANEIIDNGGTWKAIQMAKRAYAKETCPQIETLFGKLQLFDRKWRIENKRGDAPLGNCPTAEEARESWTQKAACSAFHSRCAITGEPVYDEKGRANGVEAAHIVAASGLNNYGFSALNSPHNLRLLRADLHRKNDSGAALAKNNKDLKTPEEFKESHAMADELRELLELLESVQ
jgi:hypothetical protein